MITSRTSSRENSGTTRPIWGESPERLNRFANLDRERVPVVCRDLGEVVGIDISDQAIEMMVKSIANGALPPERTFTTAKSFPSVEVLKQQSSARARAASR